MDHPDRPDRDAPPVFSKPVRPISAMVIVLVLTGVGVWMALPQVLPVVLANPALNVFIGVVFLIGVLACFWQEWQLVTSVDWLRGVRRRGETAAAPRLLAPLATLLHGRGRRTRISSTSARSILDSVATRIDEARDITRYLVNVLIFLGLLGTFYGLATTVPAIVETIRTLEPAPGEESTAVFSRLIGGLETQLGGMGIAFASSLLGLAGSLVIGLLELFASHGQNRFYRELEEWLSSITRLGFAEGEGGASDAVLQGVGDQLDRLEAVLSHGQEVQRAMRSEVVRLADAAAIMAENSDRQSDLGAVLDRVALGQERLADAFETTGDGGLDAESRMRLRSIDVQLLRVIEELSSGRQESLAEIRQEMRQMSRTLGRARRSDPAEGG